MKRSTAVSPQAGAKDLRRTIQSAQWREHRCPRQDPAMSRTETIRRLRCSASAGMIALLALFVEGERAIIAMGVKVALLAK